MMSGKVSTGKVRSSICLPQEGCTPDGVYQQSALNKHSGGPAVKRDQGQGGWLGMDEWICPEGAFEGGRVKRALAAWVHRQRS